MASGAIPVKAVFFSEDFPLFSDYFSISERGGLPSVALWPIGKRVRRLSTEMGGKGISDSLTDQTRMLIAKSKNLTERINFFETATVKPLFVCLLGPEEAKPETEVAGVHYVEVENFEQATLIDAIQNATKHLSQTASKVPPRAARRARPTPPPPILFSPSAASVGPETIRAFNINTLLR